MLAQNAVPPPMLPPAPVRDLVGERLALRAQELRAAFAAYANSFDVGAPGMREVLDQQHAVVQCAMGYEVDAARANSAVMHDLNLKLALGRFMHLERLRSVLRDHGLDVAVKVARKELYMGAPEDVVIAMLGEPEDDKETVLKTKTKKQLRYDQVGNTNQYETKVDLVNGLVVGWTR